MSATLNFRLRKALPELLKYGRWDLLTILILHANVRNRCWPGGDYIHDTFGMSVAVITEAKKYLIERGAIELVPFEKRVGKELDLPPHQHVYQLTGTICLDNGQVVDYLYTGDADDESAGEVSDNEVSDSRTSGKRKLKRSTPKIKEEPDLSAEAGEDDEKEIKPLPPIQTKVGEFFLNLKSTRTQVASVKRINKLVRVIYTLEGFPLPKNPKPAEREIILSKLLLFPNWYTTESPNMTPPRGVDTLTTEWSKYQESGYWEKRQAAESVPAINDEVVDAQFLEKPLAFINERKQKWLAEQAAKNELTK